VLIYAYAASLRQFEKAVNSVELHVGCSTLIRPSYLLFQLFLTVTSIYPKVSSAACRRLPDADAPPPPLPRYKHNLTLPFFIRKYYAGQVDSSAFLRPLCTLRVQRSDLLRWRRILEGRGRIARPKTALPLAQRILLMQNYQGRDECS
jgi:hypothetical protein